MTTASFPVDLVPADAITSTASVVGTTARTAVFSGQILLQRQFISAQGSTGASINIPPGKVLVAFPSTDMLNATGAVQPGDHVDIMISLPISGTTRLDAGASNGTQIEPGANYPCIAAYAAEHRSLYDGGVDATRANRQYKR